MAVICYVYNVKRETYSIPIGFSFITVDRLTGGFYRVGYYVSSIASPDIRKPLLLHISWFGRSFDEAMAVPFDKSWRAFRHRPVKTAIVKTEYEFI